MHPERKVIAILMTNAILNKARKCPFKFGCLDTFSSHPLCKIDHAFGQDLMFVDKIKSDLDCPYHVDYADSGICACPLNFWRHKQEIQTE